MGTRTRQDDIVTDDIIDLEYGYRYRTIVAVEIYGWSFVYEYPTIKVTTIEDIGTVYYIEV